MCVMVTMIVIEFTHVWSCPFIGYFISVELQVMFNSWYVTPFTQFIVKLACQKTIYVINQVIYNNKHQYHISSQVICAWDIENQFPAYLNRTFWLTMFLQSIIVPEGLSY